MSACNAAPKVNLQKHPPSLVAERVAAKSMTDYVDQLRAQRFLLRFISGPLGESSGIQARHIANDE